MRLLSRTLFREIFASAVLGCLLFTAVIYLYISRQLFRFVVENPGPAKMVAKLFSLVLPQTLPYTIPLGVLVGVLLALSRKSADGEITAMRAAGVPGWRVVRPVLVFSFLGFGAACSASLWLTPWSIRAGYDMQNQLLEMQLNAEIQPLLFEERFPKTVLYVQHAEKGPTTRWRRVLLADVAPSEDRGNIPAVTLAQEAIAQPDLKNNRIQVSLRGGVMYSANKDAEKYEVQSFPTSDQALQAQVRTRREPTRPAIELDTVPLYKLAYKGGETDKVRLLQARVELNQRGALPFACIALPLAGVPLALSSRRRGKSPAVVLTVVLAFLYYIGLIAGINAALEGTLPTEVAMWLPNLAMVVLGIVLLTRMERPGRRDYIDAVTGLFQRPAARLAGRGLLMRTSCRASCSISCCGW
jgi:LPS export ABC transporter permease LptF